ncbi:MAG: hypothetical protein UHT92_01245 [Prevotella sp.]|nr:hypothetical protein [Prevotella sp.]
MDKRLEETINKIVQLSRQNQEFKEKLCRALDIKMTSAARMSSDNRLKDIEKYLGLDYYVEQKQPSLIDYSFIQEDETRNKLISDNREMMRFRYGTRNHKICFDEFCRYAHLQAEMLLNYYYYQQFNGNIEDIKEYINIKQKNDKYKIKDNVNSLSGVSYNSKLFAFDIGNYDAKSNLEYIRKVRNEISHRSPEKDKKSIDESRDKLVNMGIPLGADGSVDYYKIKKDKEKSNKYDNQIKNELWYKNYKYLLWLHGKPYDKVIDAITCLRDKVKDPV